MWRASSQLICAGASTTLLSTNESIPESSLQVNAKHKRNMLYSLQKERKTRDMALQSERPLDSTDWKIIRELQQDSRLSYNELGRRVGLSAPATAERVRKLEDAGIIASFGAQVDVSRIGLPLLVFIQLRCFPDRCLFKTSSAERFPEILEMYKLSGNHCALLKVALSSLEHLEAFNERLGVHGEQTTNVVTSNLFSKLVIDW